MRLGTITALCLVLTRLGACAAAPDADHAPNLADAPMTIYVSIGGENRITLLDMDAATGEMTHQPNDAVNVPGSPGSLTVDPSGRFLHAALRSTKQVATFVINPATGDLTHVRTIDAGMNPVYLATDRTGRHLLMCSYSENRAATHRIEADGAPAEKATQVIDTPANPHSIMTDPRNGSVLIPCTGADVMLWYALDGLSGRLTPMRLGLDVIGKDAVDAGDGPRHLCFDRAARLFVVNEKSSSLTVYRFPAANGWPVLRSQKLPTLPEGFAGTNTCADIEVTPDGRFVYASNRGHDSIAGYAVDERGVLTPVGHFPTEATPREFNIDPTGRYLIAAGQSSGNLRCYRIDPQTGALQSLQTLPVGQSPAWVLIRSKQVN